MIHLNGWNWTMTFFPFFRILKFCGDCLTFLCRYFRIWFNILIVNPQICRLRIEIRNPKTVCVGLPVYLVLKWKPMESSDMGIKTQSNLNNLLELWLISWFHWISRQCCLFQFYLTFTWFYFGINIIFFWFYWRSTKKCSEVYKYITLYETSYVQMMRFGVDKKCCHRILTRIIWYFNDTKLY